MKRPVSPATVRTRLCSAWAVGEGSGSSAGQAVTSSTRAPSSARLRTSARSTPNTVPRVSSANGVHARAVSGRVSGSAPRAGPAPVRSTRTAAGVPWARAVAASADSSAARAGGRTTSALVRRRAVSAPSPITHRGPRGGPGSGPPGEGRPPVQPVTVHGDLRVPGTSCVPCATGRSTAVAGGRSRCRRRARRRGRGSLPRGRGRSRSPGRSDADRRHGHGRVRRAGPVVRGRRSGR